MLVGQAGIFGRCSSRTVCQSVMCIRKFMDWMSLSVCLSVNTV